jgi:hypothetical protein
MIKSNSFRKVTVQTSFFIIETDKLLLIRFLPKRLILFLTSYNLQTNSFINMKSKLFSAKTVLISSFQPMLYFYNTSLY